MPSRFGDLTKLPKFMQDVFSGEGLTTLREIEREKGIGAWQLSRYGRQEPPYIREIEQKAALLGITPEEWVRGWIAERDA